MLRLRVPGWTAHACRLLVILVIGGVAEAAAAAPVIDDAAGRRHPAVKDYLVRTCPRGRVRLDAKTGYVCADKRAAARAVVIAEGTFLEKGAREVVLITTAEDSLGPVNQWRAVIARRKGARFAVIKEILPAQYTDIRVRGQFRRPSGLELLFVCGSTLNQGVYHGDCFDLDPREPAADPRAKITFGDAEGSCRCGEHKGRSVVGAKYRDVNGDGHLDIVVTIEERGFKLVRKAGEGDAAEDDETGCCESVTTWRRTRDIAVLFDGRSLRLAP